MVLNIYFMLLSFFFQIVKNDYSQLENFSRQIEVGQNAWCGL